MTSLFGGSNGAGVPFPMNTKVNTHQSAIAVPIATMIIPTTCGARVVAGATMPDPRQKSSGQINEHEANKKRSVSKCANQHKHGHIDLNHEFTLMNTNGLAVSAVCDRRSQNDFLSVPIRPNVAQFLLPKLFMDGVGVFMRRLCPIAWDLTGQKV